MSWPIRKPQPPQHHHLLPMANTNESRNRTSASSGSTTASVGGLLSRPEPKLPWLRQSSIPFAAFRTDWPLLWRSVSPFQVRTDSIWIRSFICFLAHRFSSTQYKNPKYCWTNSDWRTTPTFSGPSPSWSEFCGSFSDIEIRGPAITAAGTGIRLTINIYSHERPFPPLPTFGLFGKRRDLHRPLSIPSPKFFCSSQG